jgi:hypothetical protein
MAKARPTLEALGGCLNDSSWWVRSNAARSLSHEGDAGFAILCRAIEGDDPYARDAALAALATLRVTAVLAPPAVESSASETAATC